MWKYLVLIFFIHYTLKATCTYIPSSTCESCAECKTIDEQQKNGDESGSYFPYGPSQSCLDDDDDDDSDESNEECDNNDSALDKQKSDEDDFSCGSSITCPNMDDESDEDCNDNDDNSCNNHHNSSPPDSNICNYSDGPFGGCSPLPSRSTECSGAVDRALRSIFDLSVKLGFSVLPELDPYRPYYLSSIIPAWYVMAAMIQFTYRETESEVLNILNLRNRDEVLCVILVLNELKSTVVNTDTLRINTNGTFVFESDRYQLTSSFINTLERIFAIPSTNINFDDYIEALNDINNFVRINTDGEDVSISQVFYNNGPIRLLQLGTLYFKSSWAGGCNLPSYQDKFYTSGNSIIPDISYYQKLQCMKIGFSEYFNSLITEIDLEQGFKYIGIQPKRNVDINDVIKKLNYDSFIRERAKLQCKLTDVSFPNISPTQTKFNARKAIQRTVGNIRLYDYKRAQIKGVSYGDPQLSITHGLQNIYWLPTAGGRQCPAKLPEPEAISKNDNNVLVLIMRNNLVYMVQRVQNIPRDSYQYLAQDIIGF